MSEHFEIFNFQNADSIAVARAEGGVIPAASTFGKKYFQQKFLRDLRGHAPMVSMTRLHIGRNDRTDMWGR